MGLDENIEGALCYVLLWITGIVFYIIEKNSQFVKFHALQSILTFLPLTVLSWILAFIPIIGWIFGMLLWLLTFILWIILMLKAYQGEMFKLPVVGDIAAKNL